MRVRVISGSCATNQTLADVRDSLTQAERITRNAATVSSFTKKAAGLETKLTKGADALGGINSKLGTLNDLCLDAQAIEKIRSALLVLNNPNVVIETPDAAAKAFGDLFAGVGRFVGKLPPPINAYAQILEGSGGLIEGLRRAIDPGGGGGKRQRTLDQIDANVRN